MKKKTILLNQLKSLNEYSKVLTEGEEQCHKFINEIADNEIRKEKIVSLVNSIMLPDPDQMLAIPTQPKIAFPVISERFQKFFHDLVIDDCDVPFPPILSITGIFYTMIQIEWAIDERQRFFQELDFKRIVEFVIEYSKIPKDKYKTKKDCIE